MLEGVNVALGVTGSIAAVTTVELAHELRRQGASVRAVMSPSASGIIHPWAVEFATKHDVVTEITGQVEHVDLCGRDGWADVFLIAPATANTVGKIAGAVDDTPVTTTATTALGAGVPVVIAPAMHEPMYDHPGVLDSIARVEEWGVDFVDPRIEEGKAKIATEAAIVTGVARATTEQSLAGNHVIITSGATSEAIDPIRVLTNRASGSTGRAIARACHVRGAEVTLVHDGPEVHYANTVSVESAAEMLAAVEGAAPDADALISAAAISDYTVKKADTKLRSGEPRTLDLEPTPKILDSIRQAHPNLMMVGFKAETTGNEEAMVDQAAALRDRVDLAFVVANDASVMGSEETRALLVGPGAESPADCETVEGSKQQLGDRVARQLAERLSGSTDA
ncbi:phosphopantothenoylcysteine decarboxylase/phosphopantothenate--cysteine ligase [Halohasta litchfieldiae]|jgi:phosphopantothenoylcysteine decarboxylase/phosphopantothenate--cysteine ligase|uniref:Coenzyme A biosynthesis bifunctional protein CoaBC n=1 Tax=Halohasta litchfieldiae TaxID=1073996 RepID=A0A1H6SK62_9EURY|nr:bifunctional phosphopantothenoylcysteine decarboxylase/phosphopantothenate--cysteine ligase CoaBC [Halohasta litchfieldiae]ATW89886.1 phosphopantothenoylcysteine decarboxylase/phosphopantothenate--cysteine ligase [Halohasta litchfieldiae]SEI67306.1 Phosphopantothenate-cysteine ligase /Phosphopantothenoylcysteine decarboxylase [Halohasta litchfieldiae]